MAKDTKDTGQNTKARSGAAYQTTHWNTSRSSLKLQTEDSKQPVMSPTPPRSLARRAHTLRTAAAVVSFVCFVSLVCQLTIARRDPYTAAQWPATTSRSTASCSRAAGSSTMRGRVAAGSIEGTADSSACVYG